LLRFQLNAGWLILAGVVAGCGMKFAMH
jgi:hypothetical protein